ncbi:MAG: DUF1552 domain-containing protein, partial [Planctomycetaceae bacterium]|nr:DUF1552 domain-containing protein [Planctomycetaceae bacterium]
MESLLSAASSGKPSAPPRRMVCVGNEFGMYPGAFWPEHAGADYEVTPLPKPLEPHRPEFPLFSPLHHGPKGAHSAIPGFLT